MSEKENENAVVNAEEAHAPMKHDAEVAAAEPAAKSSFLLPLLAGLGIIVVLGVVVGVVALSAGEESSQAGAERELNQLTFLNVCEEANVTADEGVEGISACFGEQAGFCSFNAGAPFLQLENCTALGLVCRCGRGENARKVFQQRGNGNGNGNGNGKAKGLLGLCIDPEDVSDDECSELSDASDFFSDSSDASDTEDEEGLEEIAGFQADCIENPEEVFFVCLNDELSFSCIGGIGILVDCDNRITDKCDDEPFIKVDTDPCVEDEDTSSDSSESIESESSDDDIGNNNTDVSEASNSDSSGSDRRNNDNRP